ncbi:hypothetical protein ACET3X_005291 [Alternaria dauci]|uniref:Uncharacterized protein n=1 Tax=Alternaria dauci TaxID=48095 RepID=A0ABR3UJV4_9PLEO
MHTAEGPTEVIEIDVDRVDPTATIVRRDDMSADTMSVPRAANDRGPSCQAEKAMKTRESFSLTSLKPASQKHTLIDAHESPSKPSAPPPVQGLSSVEVITDSNQDVLLLSCSPHVSKEAQPYFEYSVFQRVWSSEQTEENIAATETTVRPFTNIVEANEQAEKTFQSILAHFRDTIFESSTARDEHGCSILTGSVTPFDNPFKKTHLRIWVRRDTVSKFANQKPQALKGTSFISSTCYILRLFNLAEQADEESPDASDLEDGDSPAHELVRVYQTHSRPEVYTSLDAANRAARALQIELSHEKEPKDEFSRTFQQNNLQELDRKLRELQSREVDGENGGCWKSKFNACGLGADTLEVVVEKTGICGARNI